MEKKHITKFVLALALPVLFLNSCKFEEDDYFDENAALRIEHAANDIQQKLGAPANGWVMQYFCGSGVAHFEGFNILARFDANGKVTLAGNHRYLRDDKAGTYTEATSLYELLLEDGPVLALNTWNDVLTPFVDPVNPWKAPRTLNMDGAGMQGDNNFVIMKFDESEILLRGERYGGRTRLVPCDRPWQQYLLACDSMKNYVSNSTLSSYYIMGQTDTLYITGLRNGGRLRLSERLDDPLKNDSLSAVFTPRGIRLEKTDTIGRDPFQEFFLADDSTCLQTTGGNVKIIACWDTYIISNRSSVWNFDTEQLSDEQKALVEQMNTELKKMSSKYSFANIGLGLSTGKKHVNGLVITFYTATNKKSTRTVGLELTTSRPGYGMMAITFTGDESVDGDMTTVGNYCDIPNLARQFAATLSGTYAMTPDDYFCPTGCVLQQIHIADNGDITEGSARYIIK